MECKFKVGDRVKRVSNGEYMGMKEGDVGIVTSVTLCPIYLNWELLLKGYKGLYSAKFYAFVAPKRSHFPAWF